MKEPAANSNRSKQLNKRDVADIFALTPMQEGMLFHYLKEPQSGCYFEQLTLLITGEPDLRLFERAWNVVIETNEMLRAVFRWKKLEHPVQVILKEHKLRWAYRDLSESGSTAELIEKAKAEDRKRKFDLEDIAFRVTLCRLKNDKYAMMISNHHILYDGWSNGILLREFFQAYRSLVNFESEKDRRLKPQAKPSFKEFVQWSRALDKDKQEQFWQEYLAGFTNRNELPIKIDKKVNVPSTGVGNHSIILEKAIKDRLDGLARKQRWTSASLFYAAWGLMLQRYCGSDDVIFGTTVSGRSAPIKGIENMVGLFINTVPLRIESSADETVTNLLDRLDEVLALREEYESTPLVDIKEYSALENDEELFDSIVVIENYPLDRELMQQTGKRSLQVDSYAIVEATSFDLTAAVTIGDKIEIDFLYNPSLFEESSIVRLARHFTNILNHMQANPGSKITHIELLCEEEKQRLLYDFNDTAVPFLADTTVHRLVEEQAKKTPDHIAVIGRRAGPGGRAGEVRRVAYRQLNAEANQLARLLRNQGLRSAKTVGIMMERSVDMVVALLAVLKAGGTYLPVDPEYPEKRISRMLANADASMLLTHSRAAEKRSLAALLQRGILLLEMDRQEAVLREQPAENLEPVGGPDDLIYIIFTSGSTGTPKGAGVYQRSFMNLMHWFVTEFGLHADDRNLLLTSLSFDLTQKNFYAPLITGGALCIPAYNYFEPRSLLRDIHEWQVTWLNCTPGMFHKMVECEEAGEEKRLTSLRYLFLGGEPIAMPRLIGWLESPGCRAKIVNTYGPSECTDISNYYRIEEPRRFLKEAVPIGKPVYNVKLYITDRHLRLLPVGVPGELSIGGAGVGIGYIDDKDLSAQKFIKHSFEPGEPEQLVYRTGDLAKWLPDGNIEFLGRIDHQVKVRGFRIELGEIENRLSTHPAVKEAVVITRGKEGMEKYLCAYIVSQPGAALEKEQLRNHLALELPAYMVPPYFVMVEEMPLTANGKVDRKSLPEPDVVSSGDYIPPRDDTENMLAEIWAEVLGIAKKQVGIHDNFFRLGGHSLKATALTGRIYKTFSVEIPIDKVFETPTIEGLSRFIAGAKETLYVSIEAVEEKEYYPLSSSQKRLFLIRQMDPSGIAYNLTGIKGLRGKIDEKRFEECFRTLIERHESLRTCFVSVDEEPVQEIVREAPFEIEFYSAAGETEKDKIITDFVRPFDLSKAPLLRVGLVHLHNPGPSRLQHTPPFGHPSQEGNTGEKHLLMFDMHHIVCDGVSMEILIKEFTALYAGDGPLPGLRLQYRDFSDWQNNLFTSTEMKRQESYWLHRFAGEIPVLELPLDHPRPSVQQFAGRQVSFAVGEEKTRELDRFVREIEGTRFTVLTAVFSLLLAKLSGQEDIVIGTPASGRSHHELENIIGMFVNTLALRIDASGRLTFSEFTRDVGKNFLAAFENQDYPYEYLVEKVVVNRDVSRNPLFDAAFFIQGMEMEQVELPDLELTPYEYEVKTSKFDLTLIGTEIPGNLRFAFEYSTNLFKESTIRRYISYFNELLSAILADSERQLSELEIIPEEEKQQILFDFNDTWGEYPGDKTIHELFEQQAARTPDGVAVVGKKDKVHITYSILNEKADRLVRYLLCTLGVKENELVGLLVERSIEMIAAILGILKAGCGYVPLDTEAPMARTGYILDECRIRILLSGLNGVSGIREGIEVTDLLSIIPEEEDAPPGQLTHPGHPARLCYIIYTSGSTGKPKGVAVTHSNLCPLLHWGYTHSRIGSGDRIIQNLPYYFDWSAWEIFITLTSGASLYPVSRETLLNVEECLAFMNVNRITVLHITPTQFGYYVKLNRKLATLKYLFLGAEKLTHGLLEQSLASVSPGCRVFNMYGPTEAAIISAVLEIDRAHPDKFSHLGSQPIGQPAANAALLVLDRNFKLCPLNTAGELYIGGAGVAVGYVNHPELTAEKFVTEPMLHASCSMRLYRTGDLCRWLPDGNIEFLGRIDTQVKIRGFRIELGEVEKQLIHHDRVKEAFVTTGKDKNGDTFLAAYIIPLQADSPPDDANLRKFLSHTLPNYMVPSYFIQMKNFPLSPNGKIDLRALPKPDIEVTRGYIAPANDIEKKLAALWADVLSMDKHRISTDANFFELGGHSLNAAVLSTKIHKELGVKITLAEIFAGPTIREIAIFTKNQAGGGDLSAVPVARVEATEKKEYYQLSSSQMRLFFLNQMEGIKTTYNLPVVMEIKGILDKKRFEKAFHQLIQRHETLRTSFHIQDGIPVQVVHEGVDIYVNHLKAKEEEIKDLVNDFIQPFDLGQAPLFRVALVELSEERYYLLFDIHHIVSDGVSSVVLLREFAELYEGRILPVLSIQYRDYSRWQLHLLETRQLKKQEAYWLSRFVGELPMLNLRTDYPRPTVQDFTGDCVEIELGLDLTGKLQQMVSNTDITLFMVFLAAFNVLLSKYTEKQDIVVGVPIAGRSHPDVENLVGMFVNTLAMRNEMEESQSFRQFLQHVRENALNAFDNQDYPLEELVNRLGIPRELKQNPLFNILFVFENFDAPQLEMKGLSFTPCYIENKVSHLDLVLYINEEDAGFKITLEYATALFKSSTIEQMLKHYTEILGQVVEWPERPLKGITVSHRLTSPDAKTFLENQVDFEFQADVCEA